MKTTRIREVRALEALYDNQAGSDEKLASYHILKEFLESNKSDDKLTSQVPLILQGLDKNGHYEYKRREVK